MSEIVFILGAGASKDAGAPLMANFLDEADELRKANKVGEYKVDFDHVFKARAALQPVHSKTHLSIDNVEDVFAAFEMGRVIGKLPGVPTEDMDSLLSSIRRLIFITLEKTVTYPVRNAKIFPHVSYDRFAQLINDLNDNGMKNRCCIITFNYDLALDHALYCHGIPAYYCLSDSQGLPSTTLLKLHGSLNWARCSKCGGLLSLDFDTFFHRRFILSLEGKKSISLNLASVLVSSGIEHCGVNVKCDPIIIPPTWNKTQYHQGLSQVWKRAALELESAENIFVSGYSLTESDPFFRHLLGLGTVGETVIKRFWVFDPDEGGIVEKRYWALIGPGVQSKFRFERKTFSQATEIIRKELRF